MSGGSLGADRWESTSLGTEGIEMGEISIGCDGRNNHRKDLPYLNMYHHICPSKRACSLLRRDDGRKHRKRRDISTSHGRGGRGRGMRPREGYGYKFESGEQWNTYLIKQARIFAVSSRP